jgi:predicted ATPase
VPVLSVGEILQRLGDRFRLLTGGRRTAVPRQQTLQALIDWSWELLPGEDRRLLRCLSVFSGGWTLEAASAVCGATSANSSDGDPDTLGVLDALTLLVERSLVVVEQGPRRDTAPGDDPIRPERLVESNRPMPSGPPPGLLPP